MPIPTDHWQRALALMASAVTLRADEREAWLERVTGEEPAVAPLLNKLLNARRRVETHDVLATLPRRPQTGAAAPTPSTGSTGAHIGPFELIELLGLGGMGSVWRARYSDGNLKRDVAVKLPATSDNPAALAALRERFARERDFLAQLEHPNIARLYDAGITEEGQPFLAMEYVAGVPIDAYCDQHKLPIKARLTLYLQVLAAVEYAHRQLVLHRDLKPGNVLVDATGQVRLLDFGVAKLLPATNSVTDATAAAELTEMAGAAITLAYAAPEQINNGRLSTATDVYALGVMLYRLLTSCAPYQPTRESRGALEEEVLSVSPATASSRTATQSLMDSRQSTAVALRRALRGDIDTILAKALKKNSDERYPTVAAFADDLRRHLHQQPIHARADRLWYRMDRFVARHKVSVAASALAVTALFATTGAAIWQARAATQSAALAANEAARATKEAARAATVQKFLAGMFSSADPEQTKSSSLTGQQILERGRAAAERDLANDPEAHALVLEQIGDIYRRMGMPEQLLAVQKRRVEVLEAMPSVDVNSLVDAQLELGRALGDSDDVKDNNASLPRLKEAYETAVKHGANPGRVTWALCLIADQYRVDKNLVAAKEFAAQALEYALRTLPNPNRFLAAAYEANAIVAREQRRIADAREHLAKALAIDATGKGRGLVDQSITLTFLAQLEYADGDYQVALQQAQSVIELAKDNFGDTKSNLAPALRLAAFSAARAGDMATAQRLIATPMDGEIASNHPMRTATTQYARGLVATLSGDFHRAHSELDAAAPALAKNPVWSDRLTILQSELALREGQVDKSVEFAEATRVSQTAKFGSQHSSMADTYRWLAVAEARAGKADKARAHMEQACTLLGELRIAHPARLRCEAYRILLAASKDAVTKDSELQRLEAMLLGERNQQLPLLRSIQFARKQVVSLPDGNVPASSFPILE